MGGIRAHWTTRLGLGALFLAASSMGALAQEADPLALTSPSAGGSAGVSFSAQPQEPTQHFIPLSTIPTPTQQSGVRLELSAGGGDAPFDVSLAQNASLGTDSNGDIALRAGGSELRVGRGLVDRREQTQGQSVYMFVASDDEALTWQPGARSEFGGQGAALGLENRVNVGNVSAGVTYEQNGVQASLAYVERGSSTRVGAQSFSQDEAFTGVTVTMRH